VTSDRPPLYKEFLVGILVGGLLGPLVGWFIGTFAAFFAVTAMDSDNVRSMRGTGFFGGLLGIPWGLAVGLLVSLPMRLMATRGLTFLKNPWLAALIGAVIGWLCAYLTVSTWYSTFGSLIYVVIVSMVVGGITGSASVSAKPKWL
jgi:hypothetical protein